MSEPALSIGLFDPEHGLNISGRSGATLVFQGSSADVRADGPSMQATRKGWEAELDGLFSVKLEPIADGAELLDGLRVHACAVSGKIGGQKVKCFGTVSETSAPPSWAEIELLRSISAVLDRDNAFMAVTTRPAGAAGHDAETVGAWLRFDGKQVELSDARISTVYDGEGRQRSAGLELLTPARDYAIRGSGTVVAGTSLALDEVDVHAAAFRWRIEDREGMGAFEVWVRRADGAAA